MYTNIKDILEGKVDGEVELRGWVYNYRSSGGIFFVIIRDGTGEIQCTLKKELDEPFEKAQEITQESAIKIKGTVKQDERAPGGYEIIGKDIELVHKAEEYPITKKEHGDSFLLDNRHLHIRTPTMRNVFLIKDTVLTAVRDWFHQRNFIEVTPPIIVKQIGEGGGELFKFDYFGEEAYLSQTAQLHLESLIYGLEKVYSITPSFRAEKSRTKRHLTEYWHIEAEAAWVDNEENMKIQEELISYICQRVVKERSKELENLGRNPKDLEKVNPPFPRITYDEAIEILKKDGFDVEWGADFGTPEEKQLSTHFEIPFFITGYPKEIKSFYMKEQDEKRYACADLIAPEGFGEIIGGSERETDYQQLIERIQKRGEDVKDYGWYLDLRKYGSVPHSGFGIGTERIMRWICNRDHIRETIPFPRLTNRFYP